jgi:hypothetical protein
MSINDIITKIADLNGLQKKSKYNIQFILAGECEFGDSGLSISLQDFQGEGGASTFLGPTSVVMSGRTVELIADQTTGPGLGRLIPINPSFESRTGLLMKFPIDGNWKLYTLLDKWIRILANDGFGDFSGSFENNLTSANFYNECARNGAIIIQPLSYNGSPNKTITFYEAFPVQIQPLEFNSAPTQEILTFDVTFSYRQYRID